MAARGRPLIVAAAALLCALSLQGCVLDGSLDEFLDSPGIQPPSKRSSPTSEELDAPKIFRRASPAVSTVISSFDADGQATAIGTGFAIGGGRTVVTNAHVVTDTFEPAYEASEIHLQREDGARIRATVAGIDYHADIAVLDAEQSMTD